MLRCFAISILAFTFVVVTGCGPGTATLSERDREHLQQRQSDFLTAMSAQDVEQTTAHFAEDAVAHIANMPPIQGRSAIQQLYENVFRFLSTSEYSPELIRVSSSADMGYTEGRVTTVFEGEQGPVEYPGKYLLVWEKRDDAWSIVVYSISNNQPDVNQ